MNMVNLGLKLEYDPLPKIEFISSLIFFEAPLLDLYMDKDNKYYFFRFVDDFESQDGWIDRYLVYEVDKYLLKKFFQEKKTSLDLIKLSQEIYILDCKNENDEIYSIKYDEIPKDYLPLEDSLFNHYTYSKNAIYISLLFNDSFSKYLKLNAETINEWLIVLTLVDGFFNNIEKTTLWFNTNNTQLADLKPKEMMILGKYKRVFQFIEYALDLNKLES